ASAPAGGAPSSGGSRRRLPRGGSRSDSWSSPRLDPTRDRLSHVLPFLLDPDRAQRRILAGAPRVVDLAPGADDLELDGSDQVVLRQARQRVEVELVAAGSEREPRHDDGGLERARAELERA